MSGSAWDVLKRKAVFLLCVRILLPVDLAQKHGKRTDPQAAVAVELPVNHAGLTALGVLCKRLHEIIIAFEMAVDPPDLKLLHTASPLSHKCPAGRFERPAGFRFYFASLFLSKKYSFVSFATTPDRANRAIKFGIAMRPLNVSAMSHTTSSDATAPTTTTMMNRT